MTDLEEFDYSSIDVLYSELGWNLGESHFSEIKWENQFSNLVLVLEGVRPMDDQPVVGAGFDRARSGTLTFESAIHVSFERQAEFVTSEYAGAWGLAKFTIVAVWPVEKAPEHRPDLNEDPWRTYFVWLDDRPWELPWLRVTCSDLRFEPFPDQPAD